MTGTFLVCTGSEDPLCTPDLVLESTRALENAGVDWSAHVYGGAKHAFWHPPTYPDGSLTAGTTHIQTTLPGVGYHPVHAARACRAALDLFGETVGAPADASGG